jgi:hypothetical protein
MPIKKDIIQCKICNFKINNFERHIKSETHIQNIHQSEGQKFILKLVKKYNKKNYKKNKKNAKKNNIK